MTDHEITEAMMALGGSFVSQLGRLFRLADDDNRRRLKAAFPEYWAEYAEFARALPEAAERQARRKAIGEVIREETLKSLDYRLANDDLDGYDYTGGGR